MSTNTPTPPVPVASPEATAATDSPENQRPEETPFVEVLEQEEEKLERPPASSQPSLEELEAQTSSGVKGKGGWIIVGIICLTLLIGFVLWLTFGGRGNSTPPATETTVTPAPAVVAPASPGLTAADVATIVQEALKNQSPVLPLTQDTGSTSSTVTTTPPPSEAPNTFEGRPVVQATFQHGDSAIAAENVLDIANKQQLVIAHENAKRFQENIGAPETDGFSRPATHPSFGQIRYFLVFYPNDPPPPGETRQMPRFFAPKNEQDRAAFEKDFPLPAGYSRWEQDSGSSRAMMAVK